MSAAPLAAGTVAIGGLAAGSVGAASLVVPSVVLSPTTGTTTSFFDRFSTFPQIQLNGLEGAVMWKIILSLIFLYVGIYLYSEGRDITNTIARVFNVGRGRLVYAVILTT